MPFPTLIPRAAAARALSTKTQVVPEAALALSQAAAAETATTPFVQRVLQATTVGRTLATSECGAMGVALGEMGTAASLDEGATDVGRFVRESIAAADGSADAPLTLLLCLPVEATAAEEAAAAAAVDAALRESSLRYVAVLTAEPPMSSSAASHARNLLLWPFDDQVKAGPPLDSLFFLQLDLLRAFMVVIFSLIALLSGLCCMMAVRPPPSPSLSLSFPPSTRSAPLRETTQCVCSRAECVAWGAVQLDTPTKFETKSEWAN